MSFQKRLKQTIYFFRIFELFVSERHNEPLQSERRRIWQKREILLDLFSRPGYEASIIIAKTGTNNRREKNGEDPGEERHVKM